MSVPVFNTYFPSVEAMTDEQRAFYSRWLHAWQNGKAISIEGQISYLFCYMHTVLGSHPSNVIGELAALSSSYPSEREPFLLYCHRLTSDCYVLLGDYANALKTFPELTFSGRATTQIDSLLSLKLRVGARIAGRDLIPLSGPQVTEWGREHLGEIVSLLDVLVGAYEVNESVNLLERWSSNCHQSEYQVFAGTPSASVCPSLRSYSFSGNPSTIDFAAELMRDAEDTCREEIGLPKVGEGWVSETYLYYTIKEAFPDLEVTHHARPEWLGKQHLDIYLPELATAIEYQGEQHSQPIAYFGGEQSFIDTQRRDRKKQRLCKKHGIRLIYVHPDYNADDIVEIIQRTDRCR
jgi:hypothetical protein